MKVIAACYRHQRKALACRNILQVALHIAAIADVQVSRNLAVHAVVHHYIEHRPTAIHDGRQLIAQLISTVVHLNQARRHIGLAHALLQHVAATRSHHVVAIRAQKRNILHHNLPAHTNSSRQRRT